MYAEAEGLSPSLRAHPFCFSKPSLPAASGHFVLQLCKTAESLEVVRACGVIDVYKRQVLAYLPRFAAAGIEMNCQLVLCRGSNDGDALRFTLRELGGLYPAVKSIAAVPSGLTKYREGLYPLQPYDRQTACGVLDILEEFGQSWHRAHGVRLIYPGDEWFLLAGRPIPPEEYYDGYPQLENGVGMWRLLHDDFLTALPGQKRTLLPRRLDVVTGELAYPLISSLCQTLGRLHRNVHVLSLIHIWRTARRQTRPARRARCRPCGGPARACARAHTLLYSR